MATTVTSDVSYISKLLFADDAATQKAVVRDKPLFNATPQRTNFTSAEGIKIPAITATGQGASATIATAAANASPDLGKAFTLTQATYYTNVNISGKVLRNAMGVELARQEYGTATGVRATANTVAAGLITFTNPSDAVFIELGMQIVGSATPGSALRTGFGTVTAVNTSLGTVLFTGTLVGNLVSGDVVYRQGDASNTGANLVMAGLADWCPSSDPSATLFFGVDRTSYPSRLAGVRYNGSSDPVETVLIKAVAAASIEVGPGFKKGDIYINPMNFAAFQTSKEGGRWITEESSYGIGIEKFQIGPFKLVPDSLCPVGLCYMINDGAFVRFSCGSAPYWNDFDGSDIWLDRQTDTVQAGLVHDGQFGAIHPGRIMVIRLPTL